MEQETKYDRHIAKKLDLITGLARNGCSDEQIAYHCGVSYSTFNRYKSNYPELVEALLIGRELSDIMVENALFKRAVGYSYTETTQEAKLDKDSGEYIMRTTKKVRKHVVPDVEAAKFWLKNRRTKDWKDNPGIGSSDMDNDQRIKEWLRVSSVDAGEVGSLFTDEDVFEDV